MSASAISKTALSSFVFYKALLALSHFAPTTRPLARSPRMIAWRGNNAQQNFFLFKRIKTSDIAHDRGEKILLVITFASHEIAQIRVEH